MTLPIGKVVAIYSKRVDKGIVWLNKNRPGWLRRINLDKLDLGDSTVCILGQGFKDYFNVVTSEPETNVKGVKPLTDIQAAKYGFNIRKEVNEGNDDNRIHEWDILTAVWAERIKTLRLKGCK